MRVPWLAHSSIAAFSFAVAFCAAPASAGEYEFDGGRFEYSGYVEAEARTFTQSALNSSQDPSRLQLSAAVEPEFLTEWGDGKYSFLFKPFFRADEQNQNRTHWDIRELMFQTVEEDWEFRAGVGKVFWGVTETRHLVDIINQTDLVESPDQESKLGQPMVNLALMRDWGSISFFVLPRFRERIFSGEKGRLRTTPRVDTDQAAIYESGAEEWHVDFAVRAEGVIGDLEGALSHFYGTTRDPVFGMGIDSNGNTVLVPQYDLIHQTGLELQYVTGDTAWKLESFARYGQGDFFVALDAGFEHTIGGIFETNIDLGLLAEYLYESRPLGQEGGRFIFNPLEDDVMLAARIALNDEASTEGLISFIFDLDSSTKVLIVEGSRRIGDNMKLSLESNFFISFASEEPLFTLRKDDFVQLSLQYFF